MSPDIRYTPTAIGIESWIKDRQSGVFLNADQAADRLNRLEAQRDELLAACERLLAYLHGLTPTDPPYGAIRAALEAIRKAKGGGL